MHTISETIHAITHFVVRNLLYQNQQSQWYIWTRILSERYFHEWYFQVWQSNFLSFTNIQVFYQLLLLHSPTSPLHVNNGCPKKRKPQYPSLAMDNKNKSITEVVLCLYKYNPTTMRIWDVITSTLINKHQCFGELDVSVFREAASFSKPWHIPTKLYDVTLQKSVILILIAARTSNLGTYILLFSLNFCVHYLHSCLFAK